MSTSSKVKGLGPWALDSLLAVALAAVLGALSISAAQGLDLTFGWLVWTAFGVVHLSVAFRRGAPVVAYAMAGLAMLTVVLLPNATVPAAATGTLNAVPLLYLPSSAVFLVLLYTVAAQLTRSLRLLALAIAVVGAGIAAVRVAESLLETYPGEWWAPLYITTALVVVVLAAWSLGWFQQVRRERGEAERAEATRLAVLEERGRIARDMHDIVAHSLAVIVRQAEGGAFAATKAPEQAERAMRAIADTGREALTDMRGLLGVLRDEDTDSLASHVSVVDIPELVDRTRGTGLTVDYRHEGTPVEVGPATELAAYRLVQEALTNVVKHAGTRAQASVVLEWSTTGLSVEITDEEAGDEQRPAPPTVPGTGAGLAGLRERVSAVGGRLTTEQATTGFRVHARFPRREGEGNR